MPLLGPDQDDTSPEARVAFHIHRMGLTGTALRSAGVGRQEAKDIASARLILTPHHIQQLADALQCDLHELSRELTDDECRAWRFYRRAASLNEAAWQQLADKALMHGISHRQLSALLHIDRRVLARLRRGQKSMVLTLTHATAVSREIGTEPELLLDDNSARD